MTLCMIAVLAPPLAASLLQPLGAPLVLGLAAGLAYYGFRQGLFLATLAGLHALAATIVALGLAGPVGTWLELAQVPPPSALPGAFLGVLLVAAVGIRLAVGMVPPDVVRLPPLVDQIGGVIVGGMAGLVAAGAVLLALSFAPLPDAYRLDGGRLGALDMGSGLLGVFSRCLGVDGPARQVVLQGEPGSPAAGPVKRPAWSEPFFDADGSLTRDDGEPFVDTDGNGTFTSEVTAADTNANGRRDVGLIEQYRLGRWRPLTVLQAPVMTSKDSAYVTDGDPVETIVYQASATDADAGDVLSFSLKPDQQDEAALVMIDAQSGAVRLKSPSDRQIRPAYSFTVVVTDKAGLFAEQTVQLNVARRLKSDREPSPGLTTTPDP